MELTTRYLRSVSEELEVGYEEREPCFYALWGLGAAALLVSTGCLLRDTWGRNGTGYLVSRVSSGESSKPNPRGDDLSCGSDEDEPPISSQTVEGHIESMLSQLIHMDLSGNCGFLRYLDTLSVISPLYALVRCVLLLLVSPRRWRDVKRTAAPLSVSWLVFISKLVNFLLSETILTKLFLLSPEVCNTSDGRSISSEADCLRPLQLDARRPLCRWQAAESRCSFEGGDPLSEATQGDPHLYYYFVLAMISLLLSAPLNIFCEFVIRFYVKEMNLHAGHEGHHLDSEYSSPSRLLECSSRLRPETATANMNKRRHALVKIPPPCMLRAVRLNKLFHSIDSKSTEDEVVFAVEIVKSAERRQLDLKRIVWRLHEDAAQDHTLKKRIKLKIESSKSNCNRLASETMPLLSQQARERLLLRQLLQESLETEVHADRCGVFPVAYVVPFVSMRYLFGSTESAVPMARTESTDSDSIALPKSARGSVALVLLVVYFLAVCLLLYEFGVRVRNGSDSNNWIYRSVVSYLIVLCVFQPANAFVFDVSVSSVAKRRLKPLVENYLNRVRYVMNRLSGGLDLKLCGVQQAFSCCRLARKYPALPASRFILSLSDADVGASTRSRPRACLKSIDISSFLLFAASPFWFVVTVFALSAGYIVALQLGNLIAVIVIGAALVLRYFVIEIYFFSIIAETVLWIPFLLFDRCRSICMPRKSPSLSEPSASRMSALRTPEHGRGSFFDNEEKSFEFRNLDSVELGYISDRQERIRSLQRSQSSVLRRPQNSFIKSPNISVLGSYSLASFDSPEAQGHWIDVYISDSAKQSSNADNGTSGLAERVGPVMLIADMESSSNSEGVSTVEEESDDDDGREVHQLRRMIEGGSSPTKGYSPALNRLYSLQQNDRVNFPSDSNSDMLNMSSSSSFSHQKMPVPDMSAIGDIKRNRWVKLKRVWSSGKHAGISFSSKLGVSEDCPVPFTLLQALQESDCEHAMDKILVCGHQMPLESSKKVCRVSIGKVLSVNACCFDAKGFLWVYDAEDQAWFFAFDLHSGKRGAILGNTILPSLITILTTELRSPNKFSTKSSDDKPTAVYETIFTIQLLFVKGTALELRRSFGALADLNEAILHSMKSLPFNDLSGTRNQRNRGFIFESPLPVSSEGTLDLYKVGETALAKFVSSVERWLGEVLFLVETGTYENTNIPALITNFFAPSQLDVELATNKILMKRAPETPPPSPLYVQRRQSGKPMFEADLFE